MLLRALFLGLAFMIGCIAMSGCSKEDPKPREIPVQKDRVLPDPNTKN